MVFRVVPFPVVVQVGILFRVIKDFRNGQEFNLAGVGFVSVAEVRFADAGDILAKPCLRTTKTRPKSKP